ncbi:MAG: RNA polymerase sigma factor [Oscillospiraceae bacterium]|nr:RNA polymerase sigma factor [Oscillospiraceae bacterium]
MEHSPVHSAADVERMVREHGDMLFRICLSVLGNDSDAEDAVQETAVKYMLKAPAFQSPAHEKAWLIRVAVNQCRDIGRSRARHPQTGLEQVLGYVSPESSGVMEALMELPERYKIVLLLYYVEEYPVKDIAGMIGRTPSAVKMRLQKGRRLLEEKYRKEYL